MPSRSPNVRLAIVLGVAILGSVSTLAAQSAGDSPPGSTSESERPRIALYELSGQKTDKSLQAALSTIADSVELDIGCLQRFDVRRLPAVDPDRQMDSVRSYCQSNRIDQAILGSGSARPRGGYDFRLVIYDRKTDAISLAQKGSCNSALDMFDTTDALVSALIDKLSGTHMLFGSLVVHTEPAGALVSVNGREIGPSPLSLRGLPVGKMAVSARLPGWENGSITAGVEDSQATDVTLSLTRSTGTLKLDVPEGTVVTLHGAGSPDRTLRGPASEAVPVGSYDAEATASGLETAREEILVTRNESISWMPWKPGSILVDSTPPGVTVWVDDGKEGTKQTPCRFDNVAAGEHSICARDLLVGRRWFSFANGTLVVPPGASSSPSLPLTQGLVRRTSVPVRPEAPSSVSLPMAESTARLELDGTPPGAAVLIDGQVWKPGTEVPAGVIDVVASVPAGQYWETTISTVIGMTAHLSLDSLAACLPKRTISVNGNMDDWEGLEPLWGGSREHVYKYQRDDSGTFRPNPYANQPGTAIKAGYLCRDDHDIYVRMDFEVGGRGTDLSLRDGFSREIHFTLPGGKMLWASVQPQGHSEVGIWDQLTQATTHLASLDGVAVKGSSLVFAIPLRPVESYLSAGPVDVEIGVSGRNNGSYYTFRRPVDLISKMGSVRVSSTPPGIAVWLDGKGKRFTTPCTLDDVVPGPHTVTASDGVVGRRYYSVAHSTPVVVTPAGQATVSLPLVPGTARVELDRVPAGATVMVEGNQWRPGQEVPAGLLDILVALPSGQRWRETVPVGIGEPSTLVPLRSLAASLPRRTITVDGNVDDWGDVRRLWDSLELKPITAAYMCRDDRDIYVRMDFDSDLTGMDKLVKEIHFWLPDGKVLIASVRSSRPGSAGSWVGLFDQGNGTTTTLGGLRVSPLKGPVLELALPLSSLQKYLPGGPMDVDVLVADNSPFPSGSSWWGMASRQRVDFLK